MKVLICGADGYIGAEFIEQTKLDCVILDNYYKRGLLDFHHITPLYPVPYLQERKLNFFHYPRDMGNYQALSKLLKKEQPDAIIHLAEQPSAPFSMRGRAEATETIQNNLMGTLNLIYAVRDFCPKAHIIKLGTMGEYGCPNVPIPEGWFDCEYRGRKDRLLFPKTPHSMYHLSKVFDSDALAFACRMWGLRVTDLNQGFVYGLNTENRSRFCYDAEFGTVLNRFVVQAVKGLPLTVYGEGGQTRGFIHVDDSIQCLHLAIENPPDKGEFRVINQLTEWASINYLAELVQMATDCQIEHIENPRIEKEEHFYEVEHKTMLDYGFRPKYLHQNVVEEMVDIVKHYEDNININLVYPTVRWAC